MSKSILNPIRILFFLVLGSLLVMSPRIVYAGEDIETIHDNIPPPDLNDEDDSGDEDHSDDTDTSDDDSDSEEDEDSAEIDDFNNVATPKGVFTDPQGRPSKTVSIEREPSTTGHPGQD